MAARCGLGSEQSDCGAPLLFLDIYYVLWGGDISVKKQDRSVDRAMSLRGAPSGIALVVSSPNRSVRPARVGLDRHLLRPFGPVQARQGIADSTEIKIGGSVLSSPPNGTRHGPVAGRPKTTGRWTGPPCQDAYLGPTRSNKISGGSIRGSLYPRAARRPGPVEIGTSELAFPVGVPDDVISRPAASPKVTS
jgi:hypothetical protein